MGVKCGIIGLPNVGKSTLFNALTESQNAESANYPFCTIEPNIALVTVPDARLNQLAQIANSSKLITSYIEFVDIAGLVKGASDGEGLGNKFLSHIREVDGIIHVVRCFEDSNVTHVYNDIDPLRDIEIIETELILADIESLEKRIKNLEKKRHALDKEGKEEVELIHLLLDQLRSGKMVHSLINQGNKKTIKLLNLLSAKAMMYVCNIGEGDIENGNKYISIVEEVANKNSDASVIVICSKIEEEIASLSAQEEKKEFIQSMGLTDTGLHKIIQSAFKLLDLSCFFTIGPKEAHSWTFKNGIFAPQAAGIIHTDFETGFIRAEIVSFNDYIKYHGDIGARNAGRARLEGKTYQIQDGDVVHFRFNN